MNKTALPWIAATLLAGLASSSAWAASPLAAAAASKDKAAAAAWAPSWAPPTVRKTLSRPGWSERREQYNLALSPVGRRIRELFGVPSTTYLSGRVSITSEWIAWKTGWEAGFARNTPSFDNGKGEMFIRDERVTRPFTGPDGAHGRAPSSGRPLHRGSYSQTTHDHHPRRRTGRERTNTSCKSGTSFSSLAGTSVAWSGAESLLTRFALSTPSFRKWEARKRLLASPLFHE